MSHYGGIGVRVREDESFEQALRRFGKLILKTGLKEDAKKAWGRYMKPSAVRRLKKLKAIRKYQRLRERENRT